MTDSGDERRVGVEIEFGDLTVVEATEVVRRLTGGTVTKRSETRNKIETDHGTYTVELDSTLVHELEDADVTEFGLMETAARHLVTLGAEAFLPVEVVCPPVPRSQLSRIDDMCEKLREAGATGTDESMVYAFGIHFNPEVTDLSAENLLRHIQAFALLDKALFRFIKVDWSRRFSPFIRKYPEDYKKKILMPSYRPSCQELIEDYLDHNPSRNRALDMLPLFAHIDEARVRSRLPDEKINKRPTFHYRLANSRIGDPRWSLLDEWQSWLAVEKLAMSDGKRHEAMMLAFDADSLKQWSHEFVKTAK